MKLFKHKATQQIANLLVFFICTGVMALSFGSIATINAIKSNLKTSIEQSWRDQARMTLGDLKQQFLADVNNGIINPKDNVSVQKWAKIHLNGVRNGGKTSDGYMLRMPELQMLWDGSSDCLVFSNTDVLRTLDSYSNLFRVPSTLEQAIIQMKKYYTTKAGDNNSWDFDDSKEYLEWIILPTDNLGFNNESLTIGGVMNNNYTSFLIQLGTQEDEVFAPYQDTFNKLDKAENMIYILAICSVVICLFNMLAYVFISKKHQTT